MCGINIQGHNINNLRYADDTALIASNADDLQKIVTQVKSASSKAGLDMNVKKTKTMLLSKHSEGKKLEIKVDDNILQQVNDDLGTRIMNEAKTEEEIDRRSNIAKQKFFTIAELLTSNKLKLNIRKRLMKATSFQFFVMDVRRCLYPKHLKRK